MNTAIPHRKSPIVIAHRGASGYLPEHTLVAKAYAHAAGADYLEQDVVLTRDNVPVVFHDLVLEEVTDAASQFPDRCRDDGHWYVIDLDFAELQTLRVHERVTPANGTAVYPGRFRARGKVAPPARPSNTHRRACRKRQKELPE